MNYPSVRELHLTLLWGSETSPSCVFSKRCRCQHIFNSTLWVFYGLNCISLAGCKWQASFPSWCQSAQLCLLCCSSADLCQLQFCAVAPLLPLQPSEHLFCGCVIAEVVQAYGSRWSMSLLLGIGCAGISAGISASELVSPSWLGLLNVMCDYEYFHFWLSDFSYVCRKPLLWFS